VATRNRHLPDGNYVVLPDLQAPHHDAKAVAAVQAFIRDYQPDGLLCVGDESDQPEPSRWTKGLAGEYAGTYAAGLGVAYDVLRGFTAALYGTDKADKWDGSKPFHIVRSNHTDRTENYLRRNAPAIAGVPWVEYPRVMGFGTTPLLAMLGDGRDAVLPITWEPKAYAFAKGWLLMHGDEGTLSRQPGGTALGLARKTGASVVCGHTHRAGIGHHTTGHSGRITSHLVGLEVGHLMHLPQVDYIKTGGGPGWAHSFGVLRIRGGRVYPELVLFDRGSFCVEGNVYKV
jgi:hypothetical protein